MPEVSGHPSRPGDVWIMGQHRLLCGDSTDAESYDRLMQGDAWRTWSSPTRRTT